MGSDLASSLRSVRVGLILSLATILFGFGLGGAFGAAEASLKGGLSTRAEAVRDTVYRGDEKKMKEVVDKSWIYYKRAHLHGGSLGASSLLLALLLALLRRPAARTKGAVSAALGAGALGYGLFWLLAGQTAPALGSTGAAKEALGWLAVPSSALLLFGVVATLALTARELFGVEAG